MPEVKRRLKNVNVQFISLVDKGANRKEIIWKSAEAPLDHTFQKSISISKTDEEKQMVFGIVYSPDEVDAHGDTMTAKEIEKMAYKFMREGRTQQVDKQHDEIADDGYIAESWIVKENDPYFKETGSWAVGIKVENAETWEAVKKGEISGISMAGTGEAEAVKKSIVQKFLELVGLKKDFNDKMQQTEVWRILDAFHSAVYEIFRDDFPGDKKQALLETIDQLRFYVDQNVNITKQETQDKEVPLNPEDVTKAIEEAVAPLEKQIEDLTLENAELKKSLDSLVIPDLKPLEERLEKIESSSNGQQAAQGQDDISLADLNKAADEDTIFT